MRLYIIAGNSSEALKNVLEKDGDIQVIQYHQTIQEAFEYLSSKRLDFDTLLLIDQGVGSDVESFGKVFNSFKMLVGNVLRNVTFKFVTKEPQYEQVFKQVAGTDPRFEVHLVDKIKIPIAVIKEICLSQRGVLGTGEREKVREQPTPPQNQEKAEEKRSWSLFRRKAEPSRKEEPEQGAPSSVLKDIDPPRGEKPSFRETVLVASNNLNRVVAITGDRGSGITSTVANVAMEASVQGLNTIVLDLDIVYRGVNLYFTKFGDEVDLNEDLAASLVRCVMKPDSYAMNSCRINDNLSIITLAYSIDSRDKLLDYINAKRIINLINVLKLKYNLVLVDMPLYIFNQYPELIVHLDSIGICLNNSMHSIIATLKSIDEVFNTDDLMVFKMKSRAIITKYNEIQRNQGEPLTPENTLDIFSSISDDFDVKPDLAGIIPYHKEFDLQVDSGRKICVANAEYKNYYLNILNHIL